MESQVLVCYDAAKNFYVGTRKREKEKEPYQDMCWATKKSEKDEENEETRFLREWGEEWENFRHHRHREEKAGENPALLTVVGDFSFDKFEVFFRSLCSSLESVASSKCTNRVFFRLHCKTHPLSDSPRFEELGVLEENAKVFANVLTRKLTARFGKDKRNESDGESSDLPKFSSVTKGPPKMLYFRFFLNKFHIENLQEELPPCCDLGDTVLVLDRSEPWANSQGAILTMSELGIRQTLRSFRKSDQLSVSFVANKVYASPLSLEAVKAVIPGVERNLRRPSLGFFRDFFKNAAAWLLILLLQSLQLHLFFLDWLRATVCYYALLPTFSRVWLRISAFFGGSTFDKQPWCLTFSKTPDVSTMTGNYARTHAVSQFRPLEDCTFVFLEESLSGSNDSSMSCKWNAKVQKEFKSLLSQTRASPLSFGFVFVCCLIVILQVTFFSKTSSLEDDNIYKILDSARNVRSLEAASGVLFRLVPSFDLFAFARFPSLSFLFVVFVLSRYASCGPFFPGTREPSPARRWFASTVKLCLTAMMLRQFAMFMPLIQLACKAVASVPTFEKKPKKSYFDPLREMQTERMRLASEKYKRKSFEEDNNKQRVDI